MLLKSLKQISCIAMCYSVILFAGTSCKKDPEICPDRLTGDTSIFVGAWEWSHSYHTHNHCEPGDLVTDTLTPETEGHEFKMEFFEEGKVVFHQDGIQVAERDLFVTQFDPNGPTCTLEGSTKFGFKYSADGDSELFGCLNNDSMRVKYFYEFLFTYEPGCENYNNYFVKQ